MYKFLFAYDKSSFGLFFLHHWIVFREHHFDTVRKELLNSTHS